MRTMRRGLGRRGIFTSFLLLFQLKRCSRAAIEAHFKGSTVPQDDKSTRTLIGLYEVRDGAAGTTNSTAGVSQRAGREQAENERGAAGENAGGSSGDRSSPHLVRRHRKVCANDEIALNVRVPCHTGSDDERHRSHEKRRRLSWRWSPNSDCEEARIADERYSHGMIGSKNSPRRLWRRARYPAAVRSPLPYETADDAPSVMTRLCHRSPSRDHRKSLEPRGGRQNEVRMRSDGATRRDLATRANRCARRSARNSWRSWRVDLLRTSAGGDYSAPP